jgi:tetratricopeptide repeat protein
MWHASRVPGEELGRGSQQSMEDSLAHQRRVLGHDHPDTLRVAHNLAAGLSAMGEHQQARQLDEDTLTRYLRVLRS